MTLHHHALAASATRSPQVRVDDTTKAVATGTTVDIRNNVIANRVIGYGTIVWYGPWANVVNDYYTATADALTVKEARAYVAASVARGRALKVKGTEVGAGDTKTVASVHGSPPEWVSDQLNPSPDLAAIIREIVARHDWESGNALTAFLDPRLGRETDGRGPR